MEVAPGPWYLLIDSGFWCRRATCIGLLKKLSIRLGHNLSYPFSFGCLQDWGMTYRILPSYIFVSISICNHTLLPHVSGPKILFPRLLFFIPSPLCSLNINNLLMQHHNLYYYQLSTLLSPLLSSLFDQCIASTLIFPSSHQTKYYINFCLLIILYNQEKGRGLGILLNYLFVNAEKKSPVIIGKLLLFNWKRLRIQAQFPFHGVAFLSLFSSATLSSHNLSHQISQLFEYITVFHMLPKLTSWSLNYFISIYLVTNVLFQFFFILLLQCTTQFVCFFFFILVRLFKSPKLIFLVVMWLLLTPQDFIYYKMKHEFFIWIFHIHYIIIYYCLTKSNFIVSELLTSRDPNPHGFNLYLYLLPT